MSDPCRVAVLARAGFMGDYVAEGLHRAGIDVVGPIELAGCLDVACEGVVIEIGGDPAELLPVVELFAVLGVPIVLIGGARATLPLLLQGRAVLQQPFGSYQVVESLRSAGLPVTIQVPA